MSYADGILIGLQWRRIIEEANLGQQRMNLEQQREAEAQRAELDLRNQAMNLQKQQFELGKLMPTPYGIVRVDPDAPEKSALIFDYNKAAPNQPIDTSSLYAPGGALSWADADTKAYANTQLDLISRLPDPKERTTQTASLLKDLQDKHQQYANGSMEAQIITRKIGPAPQGNAADPNVAAAQKDWADKAQGLLTQMRADPQVQKMLALVNARPLIVMGPEGTPTFERTGHAIASGATPTTPLPQQALIKPYEDFQDSKTRLNMMSQLAQTAGQDKTGASDAVLLALHLGMSVGNVKGMRVGEDILNMHAQARSFLDSIGVSLSSFTGGKLLSPAQRQSFLAVAKDRVSQDYRKYAETAGYAGAQPKPSGVDFIDQNPTQPNAPGVDTGDAALQHYLKLKGQR